MESRVHDPTDRRRSEPVVGAVTGIAASGADAASRPPGLGSTGGRSCRRAVRSALLALTLVGAGAHLAPAPAATKSADSDAQPPTRLRDRLTLFPDDKLYPLYLADLQRPGFGVAMVSVPGGSAIEEAGEPRALLLLGGRFGIVRLETPGEVPWRIQLSIEAGFYGQFDFDHGTDNVGWDGVYGLTLSATDGGPLAYKVALEHTSAHIGDEVIERTGRERINYTRNEIAAGVSWSPASCCRTYVEAGLGYDFGNDRLQEPLRLQTGLVIDEDREWLGGSLGWFLAADVTSFEERDWQLDWTLQSGLVIPSGERRWRLGVLYRSGRVPLGEYFQIDESSVGIGLWLDV